MKFSTKRIWLAGAFLILLSSLLFVNSTPKYKYKLAVCSMFKNEAPFLKEWIEYHRLLGVSHFYLYNNDSTDNYMEVLKPYIDQNIVELIDWETCEKHAIRGVDDSVFVTYQLGAFFVPYQLGAFNDCLKNKALKKAQWVAIIDTDEFILPMKGKESLLAYLDQKAKTRLGYIALYWRCYGTSNVFEIKDDELLTEKLYQRSINSFEWNKLTKSIYRPEAVKLCGVHFAIKLNKKFKSRVVNPEKFRINHYWSKSQKYCIEKRKMSHEQLAELEKTLSQINDTSIYQYLPALKERVFK